MMIAGLRLWIAGTNAWVVSATGAGGECVLIDAPPDPGAILGHLEENGLRLVALLATHGHVDHIGGVGELCRGQGEDVPVHIHDHDRHMLLDPIGTSGTLGQILDYEDFDLRPPELLSGLEDGQRVSGAGMTFTAIHTPGHTQGSTCFLLEVDGEAPVLFTGDHLFAGSIGRTDLPLSDPAQMTASLERIAAELPDATVLRPGHGPATTMETERHSNPFLTGAARVLRG